MSESLVHYARSYGLAVDQSGADVASLLRCGCLAAYYQGEWNPAEELAELLKTKTTHVSSNDNCSRIQISRETSYRIQAAIKSPTCDTLASGIDWLLPQYKLSTHLKIQEPLLLLPEDDLRKDTERIRIKLDPFSVLQNSQSALTCTQPITSNLAAEFKSLLSKFAGPCAKVRCHKEQERVQVDRKVLQSLEKVFQPTPPTYVELRSCKPLRVRFEDIPEDDYTSDDDCTIERTETSRNQAVLPSAESNELTVTIPQKRRWETQRPEDDILHQWSSEVPLDLTASDNSFSEFVDWDEATT